MPDNTESFDSLMRRLKSGSEDAASELLKRYGSHIRRVVRRKLDRHVRPTLDSEDFTQAVWASFFAVPVQKHTFAAPEELIAFLAAMAHHKVIQAYRQRVETQKRNARRERPLPETTSETGNAAVARQPSPSQLASAQEEFDLMRQRVPPEYHPMLEMLKRGFTQREVAAALQLNERTIRRVIERLRFGRAS